MMVMRFYMEQGLCTKICASVERWVCFVCQVINKDNGVSSSCSITDYFEARKAKYTLIANK